MDKAEARESTLWLRARTALTDNLSSISSTYVASKPFVTLVPRAAVPFSGLHRHHGGARTYMGTPGTE